MTEFGGTPLIGEDLLVLGGRIHPNADHGDFVDSMAIRNGVIVGLGRGVDLEQQFPELPRLHLSGETVLPGFIDAHTHIEATAISRNTWVDVRNLTVDEACARIRRIAGEREPGTWILAQGTFLQPLPTRDELDAATSEHPVLMRESAHRLQANSHALRLAGLLEHALPVGPGAVVHVDADGVPTGLVEEALELFPVPGPSDVELSEMIERELRGSFARRGVTTVYEIPISPSGTAACIRLAEERRLPVRVTLTPFIGAGIGHSVPSMELWDPQDFGNGTDSDLIATGGVKILLDGDNEQSFDSKYFGRRPRQWGALTRTLGALREEIIWAMRHDAQVWIHAIGDLAQEMMLEAVEQAQDRAGVPTLPTRLEHAANLQSDAHILRRIADLGVVPVPTASFISTDDGEGVYAYRTLMDGGMKPPGNSDTAGSIALAPSPWFGISLMLERKNDSGVPVAPTEAVSLDEALRIYTQFSAEVAGLQDVIGSLRVGMAADFAVYTQDPRSLTTIELRELEASRTFVGGRLVWEA